MFTDIDECTENGRICLNGDCMNTPGSYRCICQRGYELSPDGAFCLGMIYIHTIKKLLVCQRFPFVFLSDNFLTKKISTERIETISVGNTLTVHDLVIHRIPALD